MLLALSLAPLFLLIEGDTGTRDERIELVENHRSCLKRAGDAVEREKILNDQPNDSMAIIDSDVPYDSLVDRAVLESTQLGLFSPKLA